MNIWTATSLRRELLLGMKQRAEFERWALTSGKLVLDGGEVVTGIQLEVTRRDRSMIVDPLVGLFWEPFSLAEQHAIIGRQLGSLKLKRWQTPCLVRGFADLVPRGSLWSHLELADLTEVPGAVELISQAWLKVVRPFAETYASPAGLVRYLDENPGGPGTWRPLLEFLLRDRLGSRVEACSLATKFDARTDWEDTQRAWFLANFCQKGQ